MPQDTHPDRPTLSRESVRGFFGSPLVLALVVTLANMAKPVVIDDTAYLTYAGHISAHPADPYGFEMFWYDAPEPAFDILCPPVLPYWLGLGMNLFGVHIGLLKLWLFPFVWLLAWTLRDLLRRFARGTESRVLPLLMLSPAVLPTVNLMLDIPTLALGLAAVAVFAKAVDRRSWGLAVGAGLLAGLAMQTKYTALLFPPVILWYGLTHRRLVFALLAVGAAVAVFAGWELLMVEKYGRSHFVHHALSRGPSVKAGESPLDAFIREKSALAPPLTADLGCLGVGVALLAGAALGLRSRLLAAPAVVWVVGFMLILFLPLSLTVLAPANPPLGPDTRPVTGFWQAFGTLFFVGLAGCAAPLLLRFQPGVRLRWNADAAFLVGWVLIEVAGYFALTPFGAARRVIALTVVGGLLASRTLSRTQRVRPLPLWNGWVVSFGVVAGFAVAAVDTLDAYPEKSCAERAAVVAVDRPADATVWFTGHWGFQFYCERAGMRQVAPGTTVMRPGDVFVFPAYPDPDGFYRPHAGSVTLTPPEWAVESIAEVVWDDVISAQTVPNFYCGIDPIIGRDHPRLGVIVYRVKQAWSVPGDEPER